MRVLRGVVYMTESSGERAPDFGYLSRGPEFLDTPLEIHFIFLKTAILGHISLGSGIPQNVTVLIPPLLTRYLIRRMRSTACVVVAQ